MLEHGKDPAGGGGVERHLGHELGQPLERVPDLSPVVHEDEQRADRHAARHRPAGLRSDELVAVDEKAPVSEDDGTAHRQDRGARQGIELLLPVQAQEHADTAADPALEPAELVGLAPERLRQADVAIACWMKLVSSVST
jgi:hypothetical protein